MLESPVSRPASGSNTEHLWWLLLLVSFFFKFVIYVAHGNETLKVLYFLDDILGSDLRVIGSQFIFTNSSTTI